jgi:hypothetical protein
MPKRDKGRENKRKEIKETDEFQKNGEIKAKRKEGTSERRKQRKKVNEEREINEGENDDN